MNRQLRSFLIVAGLLATLLSFAQTKPSPGAADGSSSIRITRLGAVVTETRGTVTVRTPDGVEEPFKIGQALGPGMIITTGNGGSAVVIYPDGQICVLGERSMFRTIAYSYDPKNPGKDDVFLNLIAGSMRVVMGEIGQSNPAAVRVQIGMATMSPLPTGQGRTTDASVVVQGGPVVVSVQEGRVGVSLPDGTPQQIGSGQALYVGLDGMPQTGSTSQILQQLAKSEQGADIRQQLGVLEGFSPKISQTVITLATVTAAIKDPDNASGGQLAAADQAAQDILKQLASLPSTEEIQPQPEPQPPAFFTTGTPPTSAGGGGGGGAPQVASPN